MLDVLVVDDDPDVRERVADALRDAGHRVTEACNGLAAVKVLSDRPFDLAICDVCMPQLDGRTLLRRIRRESPTTSVVMMTTFATISDVVASLREGAVNYLVKPFDVDDLIANVVVPIVERRSIARRFEEVRAEYVGRTSGTTLIAKSAAMSSLVDRVGVVASSDAAVLVMGESGTGKDLVARTIHAQGSRRSGPLRFVDGATLLDLMEASVDREVSASPAPRDAWFHDAAGGTLVVDGIEKVPMRAQAQLLRLLDAPATRARRGTSWAPLGVRLISLSEGGLKERLSSGTLLDALYYRVATIQLRVPPLRERTEDLSALVVELLDELKPGGATSARVSPRAWSALTRRAFRGNVRELRWVLDRALALAHGEEVDEEHLPGEPGAEAH